MKIEVKVKPRSSQEKVVTSVNGAWVVYLHDAPERGKANEVLKKLLAKELGVRKSALKILRGKTTTTKLIEIEGYEKK